MRYGHQKSIIWKMHLNWWLKICGIAADALGQMTGHIDVEDILSIFLVFLYWEITEKRV